MTEQPEGRVEAIGRKKGELQHALWALVGVTALLFAFSAGMGVFAYVANSHRINDIQQSRVISCQHTYSAFHQVFKPFLPPVASQNAQEKHDIAVFNATIRRLTRQCVKQTSVTN